MEKIVTDKTLLADLHYLVDFRHTGQLEVYHSLYNKFCPKRLHFGLNGMVARSQLAVLDYNDGILVGQAVTKQGELRYKQNFSKVTQNGCVKKIVNKKSREYINDLLDTTVTTKCSPGSPDMPNLQTIPENIAPVERPNKQEAIKTMHTRFKI